MSTKTMAVAVSVLALTLASCNRTPSEPKGQVVATVGSHEITQSDIAAETGDLPATLTPNVKQAVQQATLQQIIARYIVADAARTAKLDKTPLAAILQKRGQEQALVDLLQRKLRHDIPATSVDEAKQYIADHPASFSQRRIFLVDQYVARDVPAPVLKMLEPLNTMEEVAATLTKNNVAFTKTVGVIDALSISPAAAEQIANLPANAVFVSPDAGVVRVNRVRETQVAPIEGEDAIRVAQEILKNQRSSEMFQKQISGILQAGAKDVRYNPAFRPQQRPAPKASAAAKPAA